MTQRPSQSASDIEKAIQKDLLFEFNFSKLSLHDVVLGPNAVRSLVNNNTLQELLFEADYSDTLFRGLGELLKHTAQLERLTLRGRGNKLTLEGAKAFSEGLAHNTTLKRLSVSIDSHNEFWSEVCGNLNHNSSLQELDLHQSSLPASFFQRLSAGLKHHRTLHTMRLYWCQISTHALAALLNHNPCISNLYLFRCKFDDLPALVRAIEASQVLTSLTFDCHVTDSEPLINSVKQHNVLTTLHLTSIFNDLHLHHFVPLMRALQSNTTLTSLGLRSNNIKDSELFKALGDMLKVNKSITHLDLLYCKDGEVYTRVAEALAVNTTMQKLELSCLRYNEIADNECEAMTDALKINRSLTDLSIMLTTHGTNRLCEVLQVNDTVTGLHIDVLYLKDSFKELCAMLAQNKVLTALSLDYRNFMNGHKLLGNALLAHQSLKKLTLTCSPVAFEHLCKALSKLPQLVNLNLKFLVTQGTMDEQLKFHALSLLKSVLRKNRLITTASVDLDAYTNNTFESEQLIETEIRRNRQLQSTLLGDMAVLLNNIAHSTSALDLFPMEIWHAIFCHLTLPGIKVCTFVNNVVKKYSLM